MRPVALLLAATAAVLALAAACGDDDDAADGGATTTAAEATTPSTTAPATTTTLSPEEEVLAAYRAARAAIDASYNPPNPNLPDLLALVGGEALTRVQSNLTQLQGQGVNLVGTTETHPTLTSLAGDAAVVEDCFVNRAQYVNQATGQPVGQPGESVLHVENQLQRIGGSWMLMVSQELDDQCTPA
jgi:hypothetical protein